MNPGYKYPVDEKLLRSKLLETNNFIMDQAWEKFESYLSEQKPIFTKTTASKFNLMIHPKFLIRSFFACLIVMPSLLFYKQFNAKIPAAFQKVHPVSQVVNTKTPKTKNTIPSIEVIHPSLASESSVLDNKEIPEKLVHPTKKAPKNPFNKQVPLAIVSRIDTCGNPQKYNVPDTKANTLSIPNPSKSIDIPNTEQNGERIDEQL